MDRSIIFVVVFIVVLVVALGFKLFRGAAGAFIGILGGAIGSIQTYLAKPVFELDCNGDTDHDTNVHAATSTKCFSVDEINAVRADIDKMTPTDMPDGYMHSIVIAANGSGASVLKSPDGGCVYKIYNVVDDMSAIKAMSELNFYQLLKEHDYFGKPVFTKLLNSYVTTVWPLNIDKPMGKLIVLELEMLTTGSISGMELSKKQVLDVLEGVGLVAKYLNITMGDVKNTGNIGMMGDQIKLFDFNGYAPRKDDSFLYETIIFGDSHGTTWRGSDWCESLRTEATCSFHHIQDFEDLTGRSLHHPIV